VNIVIVGGGTAGWLAALMLSKIHGHLHTITLIESSAIGIIGAGESSTGALRGIINNETWNYNCNELDFMNFAKATPKLSITHRNWSGDGLEYLAPIDTAQDDNDAGTSVLLNSYIANEHPMHMASINGRLSEAGLSSFYQENGQIKHINRHAYNFDARLGAKYLEKICSSGVNKIDAKVKDIVLKENGWVDSIILDDGRTVAGDFFIDASGFSRLFSKKLNVKWISYPELTLDSAMPFILPYPKDYKLKLTALSWAQKNGWMWQIPKGDDLGNGYAFDSRFTSESEAQKEIEQLLGHEIEPIKFIKYQTGRLENTWNNNVLSIGLSSSFLEPLEATSIHGTIIQLNLFLFTYLKETVDRTITQSGKNSFNRSISKMLDDFKNFIALHYFNGRRDSDFWINANEMVSKNDKVREIVEISQNRLLNKSDLEYSFGYAGPELYNWILCGLKIYNKDTAKKEYELLDRKPHAQRQQDWLVSGFDHFDWLTNDEIFKIIKDHKYE